MEEIEKIITVISVVTGLNRYDIVNARGEEGKKAFGMLCYIALKDKYGLTFNLMQVVAKKKSQCVFAAEMCKETIEADVDYLRTLNSVRQLMKLSPIMRSKIIEHDQKERRIKREKRKEDMKHQMLTVFGIEYTKEDEQMMKAAMEDSAVFMTNYCSIGRKVAISD